MTCNNFRGRTPRLNKTDCHVHENTHANEAIFYTSCTVHTTKLHTKYGYDMFSSIGDTTYSRFRIAGPLQVFLFESEV